MRVTEQQLVDAVREYAAFESNDEVLEQIVNSWEDWELMQVVQGASRPGQAIRRVRKHVRKNYDIVEAV